MALDPHGDRVPIEEAIPHKLNYYRCPECNEFVNPRKGPKRQYFAHKQGVLDDTDCELSSDADVEQMVNESRTSDIEEQENQRSIRVYLGEKYDDLLECFGVIPSLDWDDIPYYSSFEDLMDRVVIETEGIETPPVPANFHPSEPEVTFRLDPTATEYRVTITGPNEFESILGQWTADGLADGDLFVGDQSRARRHQSNRQVKQGEWVYLLLQYTPPNLPDLVSEVSIGPHDVLAFPAREQTEDLLEEYADGIKTDDYGFDADVILPADVHPTIEAPLRGTSNETVLIGVTPSEDLDPQFEVVSIPKGADDVIDLTPTGPGNPRFWTTTLPDEGSRRISVHQRYSDRHRMVHLHADSDAPDNYEMEQPGAIGLEVHPMEGDPVTLTPLGDRRSYTVSSDLQPAALPTLIEYVGPDGLDLEFQATFINTSQLGPRLTRTVDSFAEFAPELAHWVRQGCTHAVVDFDGIGTVKLEFPQPDLAPELASGDERPMEGRR